MASVHFLNVSPGDCTIIQHVSERVTMVDICCGNLREPAIANSLLASLLTIPSKRNSRMCESPTNPITYAKKLGINKVFRFVLTHPDMDHMDGFYALMDDIGIVNFWDSGARKSSKPDFEGSPYLEEDWDRYVNVRDRKEDGVTTLVKRSDAYFKYANRDDGTGGGDGLYILAPNNDLLNDPDEEDDLNDASYVLLYRSYGGRILLPGDAHDASWNHIISNYAKDVSNCSFLLAPHHGRDSDRSYDFLDVVRPKLTLIGCSPSKYIDYGQWSNRGLPYITSNQAGNVVLDLGKDEIDVYVENADFAARKGAPPGIRNPLGYAFLGRITASPER